MPLSRPEPLWLPKMRAFVSAKHLMDSVIRKCNTCNLTNQGQRAELIGLITELQISLRDLSGAYPDELCRIMVEFNGADNKKDNHPDVGIWRDFADAYADESYNSYMMSGRDERCPRFDLTEYTTPKKIALRGCQLYRQGAPARHRLPLGSRTASKRKLHQG